MTAEHIQRDQGCAIDALQADGLLHVKGLLSQRIIASLAEHTQQSMAKALAMVRTGQASATALFAEHLLLGTQCGKRQDFKLPLDHLVSEALSQALSVLGSVLMMLLGESAELFELSALQSGPGTPQQDLHADFPPYGAHDVVGFVVFVSMADQTPEMGPTIFLPKTHTRTFHQSLPSVYYDRTFEGLPRIAPCLRKGDAIIMNSALIHAGGANTSRDRPIFHFSFKVQDAYPGGRLSSLREDLREKYSLRDLCAGQLLA